MFKVAQKFGRSENFLQEFSEESQAIDFIMEKLKQDKHFKVMASYCLYEWSDLIREYTQDDIPEDTQNKNDDEDANKGAGRGSGQSFNPTPFNTAPRMPGMPHGWVKDEDDNKKK